MLLKTELLSLLHFLTTICDHVGSNVFTHRKQKTQEYVKTGQGSLKNLSSSHLRESSVLNLETKRLRVQSGHLRMVVAYKKWLPWDSFLYL